MPNNLEAFGPENRNAPAIGKMARGAEFAHRAGQRDRIYRRTPGSATALRTLFNDDGHFIGLEVVQ